MGHASRLDLASYEDPVFYDKLERARVQATDRLSMIQAVGRVIQEVITTFSLAAGILVYSPWLLAVLVLCVVPAFLGESHFAFLGYSLAFRQTPTKRQLDYLRVLGASKESAKELKLFGLAPFLSSEFTRLSRDIYVQNVALARRRLRAGALLSMLSTVGYYGTYAWVVYETVQGRLTVGSLTFLAGAIAGASTNIQMVFSSFSSIADQALFLTDLIDFFAVQPSVRSKPNALPAPRPIRDGFEFRNVSFTYPGTSRVVLDNLNFRLGPGERIALIGENGQGKTTIVKLLTRLYDPTKGHVLLDGVDLRDYNLEDLSGQIAVIFQDFMRYDLTAAENIAVGQIHSQSNRSRIEAAARKSLAHGVVARLPRGYEQMLGRRFEGGVDLSGGEWQKMALARAYLRDAQVLVLDEPTASLDARSEHEVFERFAELTEGKIALLISHRFSTVRMADRILVLEDGRIAEEGSHADLMASAGRYSEMFEMQAASYR
jgi:ATP-binding cassette subfamily B protein